MLWVFGDVKISAQKALTENIKKERIEIEVRKLSIIKADRKCFPYICGFVAGFGAILCWFGFRQRIVDIYPDEEALRKEQLKSLIIANRAASRVKFKKRR